MIGCGQRCRCVFGRDAIRPTRPGVLFGEALDHLLQPNPRLRVQRVEQLIQIDDFLGRRCRQRCARRQRGRAVGTGRKSDVAVRDCRQRRHPDLGHRALVKRRERRVDVDGHPRRVVVGQHDIRDGSDRYATDLHLVASDELAGFGEDQLIRGAASAREHQVGDDQHDRSERAEGDHAPSPGSPRAPRWRGGSSARWGCGGRRSGGASRCHALLRCCSCLRSACRESPPARARS